MRRAPLVALLAAVIALAGAAVAWRSRRTPDKVLARLAGSTRPVDARLSSPAADHYRPFAAGGRVPDALDDLAQLEKTGDRRALAEAWILVGQPDRGVDVLAADAANPKRGVASDDRPEVLIDRAAVELTRGHAQAALLLSDRALAQKPSRQGPAAWNRALALEAMMLPMAAAKQLDDVAALHEPGWSAEAHARAEKLRADAQRRSDTQQRAIAAGLQMVAEGTPEPADVVDAAPDVARLYLYDAIRAAPTAERVRALAPLAARLDRHFGGHVLGSLVDRVAARDFRVRAPLAAGYRKMVAASSTPPAEAEKLLAAARQARQNADDIYLGIEFLANRRDVDLDEYVAVARRQDDPWFDALAVDSQATAATNRGDVTRAATLLQPAIERCWAAHLEYRCQRLTQALVTAQTLLLRLDEAERLATAALQKAHATDASAYGMLLQQLAQTARLRNDTASMDAYLDEMLAEAPGVCAAQRYVHEMRAESALMRFDTAGMRRELDAVPACQQPRYSDLGIAMLGYLQRAHGRDTDEAAIGETVAAYRDARVADGVRLELDLYAALAKMRRDRAAGHADVERVIGAAKKLPDDDNARRARADGSFALIVDDALGGRWSEAHRRFADTLDRAEPKRCSLGILIELEIAVVAWRDANGVAGGRTQPIDRIDVPMTTLVPPDVLGHLAACSEVGVLAPPPLNGRPDVLPPTIAWSFGVAANAPAARSTARRRLVVSDVQAPAGLGLAPLAPRVAAAQPGDLVLRGSAATPARVIAELPDADEAEFDVHGLVDLGSADASLLVLASDGAGHYALTANDIRRLKLTRNPIIALGACSAGHTAPFFHEVWSLPAAFLEAGARAVIASASPIPDRETDSFLGSVLERIHDGATPAVALRDERALWLARSQLWTNDVMLFQ